MKYRSTSRLALAFAAFLIGSVTAAAQVNVPIGNLQPGESVVITYQVTINSGIPPTITQISSQGAVTGNNFSPVNTDDPETAAASDPTLTPLSNEPPQLDLNGVDAGSDVTVNFSEQTSQLIAPAGTLTDADDNSILSLIVTLAARPDGDGVESLSLNAAAGSVASAAGLTTGYNAATGVLSITGTAAASVYQSILQGILYNNTSDTPSTVGRSVTLAASDTNDSAVRTSTIIVTEVNDLPASADNTVTTQEDVNKTFATSDFAFTDLDGHAFGGIQIATVETAGDLEEGGIDVAASDIIEDVTQLVLKPAPNANGTPYTTFTFKVRDSLGGLSAAAYTMTVNVTAIADVPIAVDDSLLRYTNGAAKIAIAQLLANDSDADGDTLTITGVTSPTGNGATITQDGIWFIYEAPAGFNAADSFDYTISDGQGGTDTGTVNVTMAPVTNEQTKNILSITTIGTDVVVRCAGIPGRTYQIQISPDLVNWDPHPDGTRVAQFNGIFELTDPSPPSPRYYRAVQL